MMSLHARGMPIVTQWVERATSSEHFVDWVSGACARLSTAKDAEAVGLLDERFFLYTEDVDFCASMRARGRRVLFTPAAQDHTLTRPLARDGSDGDERGISAQPARLLRQASSRAGCRCCAGICGSRGSCRNRRGTE